MNTQDYTFELAAKPEFSLLNVQLPAGGTIKVEAAAMATMDSHVRMQTKLKGGFSRFLSGESLFINEFTADNAPGAISIAPACPGDIEHLFLNNQTVFVQNSGFLAASPAVAIETKWQGLTKGFFSGESFFLVKCSGTGHLWFNSFGAIIRIDSDHEELSVDTGHVVAFTEGLEYSIGKVGGYKSLFFSGEGLVCRFRGQGTVWIQTRKPNRFLGWLNFFRPVKQRNT
jgi:uncharacterized protein (TIGR00266 family)